MIVLRSPEKRGAGRNGPREVRFAPSPLSI
jgi:hypothetical protein